MDAFYVVTLQAGIAAIMWAVVAIGSGYAVFSPAIEDTFSERCGLVCVSITSLATGWRIVKSGEISDGGLLLAGAFAVYVLAIVWKHIKQTPGAARDKKGVHA